jgi:hypothetical protein
MVWPVGNSITAAPRPIWAIVPLSTYERFGLLTLYQTLDCFADVIASLKSSGTKSWQWFTRPAVDHRSDVAYGKTPEWFFT